MFESFFNIIYQNTRPCPQLHTTNPNPPFCLTWKKTIYSKKLLHEKPLPLARKRAFVTEAFCTQKLLHQRPVYYYVFINTKCARSVIKREYMTDSSNHNMTRTWLEHDRAWLIWARHTGTWQRHGCRSEQTETWAPGCLTCTPRACRYWRTTQLTWTDLDIARPRKRHRDTSGTRKGHHRNAAETSPGQEQDMPSHMCSARRIIHVRPQAYRYWGIMNLHQCSSICQCSTSVVLKLRNCIYPSFTKCGIWHRQHVFPII